MSLFTVRVEIHNHADAEALARIEAKLDAILAKENTIMATQADLQAAIDAAAAKLTSVSDAETAIETLLASNTQLLRDALNSGGTSDQIVAQVTALTDAMEANRQKLVDATVANTPAAP